MNKKLDVSYKSPGNYSCYPNHMKLALSKTSIYSMVTNIYVKKMPVN